MKDFWGVWLMVGLTATNTYIYWQNHSQRTFLLTLIMVLLTVFSYFVARDIRKTKAERAELEEEIQHLKKETEELARMANKIREYL